MCRKARPSTGCQRSWRRCTQNGEVGRDTMWRQGVGLRLVGAVGDCVLSHSDNQRALTISATLFFWTNIGSADMALETVDDLLQILAAQVMGAGGPRCLPAAEAQRDPKKSARLLVTPLPSTSKMLKETAVCTVSLKKFEIDGHGGVLSASSVPHVCAQLPCVANWWSPEPSSSKGMHHGWTNMLTRKICAAFVLEKHSEIVLATAMRGQDVFLKLFQDLDKAGQMTANTASSRDEAKRARWTAAVGGSSVKVSSSF